jgi:ABC-type antimicrobial peptide transport system permease subunit
VWCSSTRCATHSFRHTLGHSSSERFSAQNTERVTIPGFGKLIVDAVFNRDYAVVQGVVLFTATAYILLNLAADIAYVLVNPQIRVQ